MKKISSSCCIYLVGNKELNYYKIGVSTRLDGRMKELNLPFEVKIIHTVIFNNSWNAFQVERKLHQFYKELGLHLRGEWFKDIPSTDFVNRTNDLAKTCRVVDERSMVAKYTTIIKEQAREARAQKQRDKFLLRQLRAKKLI